MLVSCLAYSSTLKMEVMCSSEMSVDFHRTTGCYNPEDTALQNYLLSTYVKIICLFIDELLFIVLMFMHFILIVTSHV
jgi:hypothetical protein